MPERCSHCTEALPEDAIRCPGCFEFVPDRLTAAIDRYHRNADVSDPDNAVHRKRVTFREKVRLVFPRVEAIAKRGETSSQTPIQGDGVDVWGIKYYLGAVSTIEHWDGRPLLSSVIINATQGYPADGYFTLVEKLGRHSNITALSADEQERWWQEELAAVHDVWEGR